MPNVLAGFQAIPRRTRPDVKRRPYCIVWALSVFAIVATPARAQTHFELPDLAVHLDRYVTVEECLAVTGRVRDSVEQKSALWRDTTPMTPVESRAPMPTPVTEVASKCGARFVATAVPLSDFAPLLQYYVVAGRDADAATLITRRLQAIKPEAERERAAVLDTAATAYVSDGPTAGNVSAQPARLAAAEPLIAALEKLAVAAPWEMRMRAYRGLMLAAQRMGDTLSARRAADGILNIAATLTPAIRRTGEFTTSSREAIYPALDELAAPALRDSLKRSTAGFVAIKRANWAKATGEGFESFHFPIGQQAPPIEADFSFRRADAKMARPSKGKTALVVFLDDQQCADPTFGAGCFAAYAQLRRLANRFPELEITLVAQTHGYLTTRLPPTPAEEADTLAHWWLESDRLPGALAVTATDFWRLPAPDRRRIDRDVANITNYSFGQDWRVFRLGLAPAYLVDRAGIIVDVSNLADRFNEVRIAQLIEALFAQQVASR